MKTLGIARKALLRIAGNEYVPRTVIQDLGQSWSRLQNLLNAYELVSDGDKTGEKMILEAYIIALETVYEVYREISRLSAVSPAWARDELNAGRQECRRIADSFSRHIDTRMMEFHSTMRLGVKPGSLAKELRSICKYVLDSAESGYRQLIRYAE